MADKKEIRIGETDIFHEFFDYLAWPERKEINTDNEHDKNIIVSCYINDQLKYSAVIETQYENLHVREVGGNFTRDINILEIFAHALGKFWNKKYISFCTKRKGVERIGEKLGFSYNEKGEFAKEVFNGR